MFGEFGRWFRQIFQEADAKYSSKRTIALFAFAFLLAAGTLNLTNNLVLAEFMFDGFMWIVIGGVGISIGERMASVFGDRLRQPRSGKVEVEVDVDR